jgi:hypothetical protein
MKLGGFENEVQSNGDGTARIVKTRVPWGLSGLMVETNDARSDLEFLKEIADGQDFVTITITMASGITYQGVGQIVDEVQRSTQSATSSVGFMGQGSLSKQ